MLSDDPATIIGVMPATFDFGGVFAPGTRADVFIPMALESVQNWGNTLAIVGRLKPGVHVAQAQAEFDALNENLFKANPNWRFWTGARLSPLRDSVSGRVYSAVLLLSGAVGLVLLIVCLNIANLLLARATSRQKEISVRAALGAGRGRIVRQLLTESLLLSTGGALAGLALARLATAGLARLPVSVPLLHTIRIDGAALAFLGGITVLTALLFGLAPALAASRIRLTGGLNDSTRGSSESAGKGWFRNALVVAEVALACVLLSGCGLLIRSFVNVLDVDLGFRPERVFALRVDPTSKYDSREKRLAFIEELSRRVAQIPGVEMSSLTDALPLDRNRSWTIGAKGRVYSDGNYPGAYVRFVFPEYFRTMNIALRAGRDFTEQDKRGSPDVIIVNETGARTHWPGENAVGKIVMLGKTEVQVVGVVADVKHSGPEQESGIEMYLPFRQSGSGSLDIVMRSRLNAAALSSSIRSSLRPVDPNLPLGEIRSLESLVDRAVSPRRFVVWLLAAFAALAVLLASLGVYGVVSYSVSRRTQEIGIRMALGASAREVQFVVLKSTAGFALAGAALGVAAAIAAGRLIETMLYNVSARDPLTLLAAPIALTTIGIIAAYVPARRASRIDPISALRVT
jgi:predicted permease